MSCTSPFLMLVENLAPHERNHGYYERLEKLGYKINKERHKAYRLVSNDSTKLPLELIDKWQTNDIIEVPCGSCTQCRLDYARDWATRCVFESKMWKHNIFLTLNYDDDHVPYGKYGNMSLDSEEIRQFIRSLRNKFKRKLKHTGVRYLLCGEYNSSGERLLNPHYHMILFNCPLPDLTIDIPDGNGHIIHKLNDFTKLPYMFSQFIADLWTDKDGKQKGQVIIDDANFNTESYVSRYIMKKQKGKDSIVYSRDLGVEEPFLRMSNKPGIGFNMFIEDSDKFIDDPSVIIPRSHKKPLVTGLPKYFKRKLIEKHPQLRTYFEELAKYNSDKAKLNRAAFGHTSNQQKQIIADRAAKIASVFQRNK